ncbi:MAG: Mo-dependent nitrogenase C-terminal domain-containing protein [Cyanobacteriota bacterium]|nr:Mo-dependent nitrogenase C-terminal domain-containing protein [Cyanobacteriota bacterium]
MLLSQTWNTASRKLRSNFVGPIAAVRQRLETIEIRNSRVARWLCKLIPAQCPFAREIRVLGRTLFRIPPLCKLNPFYEQLMTLRFRALCFLADVCGEDISGYC